MKNLQKFVQVHRLFSVGMKMPSMSKDTLALIYTPGVGEISMRIHQDPPSVDLFTNRMNMVAVIAQGKTLGLSPLATLPYLDYLSVQLKSIAGLDAFPIVVSHQADLATVVNDLGNSMAGVVALEDELPSTIDSDIVFLSQTRMAKHLRKSFLCAETSSLLLRERLLKRRFGVVSADQNFSPGEQLLLDQPKRVNRVFSKYTNKENAIFVHSHFRGKVASVLHFTNWEANRKFIKEEELHQQAKAIDKDPSLAREITSKKKLCAIVTDGTAILGFGNIGTRAGLPVMEGKCCLFKHLGDVDVIPICIKPRATSEESTTAIRHLIQGFAGINLEDISAPQCFDIEESLKQDSGIPIFHDDQHGTAVVTLAGLINACRIKKQQYSKLKVVINGAGAAGLTIAKLLLHFGFKHLIICDTKGILHRERGFDGNKYKKALAELTNEGCVKGSLADALKDADIFIGVSVGGALAPSLVRTMAKDPIIFALANPVPEIFPHEALREGALIVATGRSDFPNQINNSLVFPGIFKGLLSSGAKEVSMNVKAAAALAIANSVREEELSTTNIVPESLNPDIPQIISREINNIVTHLK